VLGLAFSRLLRGFSSAHPVPFAVLISALVHIGEFFTFDFSRDRVVTFTYFHIVGFGAILLSGFFSVARKPLSREAKLCFGLIEGAGKASGIKAERKDSYANQ
jgi:hypothetical protein